MPFLTEKHASIAKQVIEVDAELQPQAVKRTLSVEGNQLKACVKPLLCCWRGSEPCHQNIPDTHSTACSVNRKCILGERGSCGTDH